MFPETGSRDWFRGLVSRVRSQGQVSGPGFRDRPSRRPALRGAPWGPLPAPAVRTQPNKREGLILPACAIVSYPQMPGRRPPGKTHRKRRPPWPAIVRNVDVNSPLAHSSVPLAARLWPQPPLLRPLWLHLSLHPFPYNPCNRRHPRLPAQAPARLRSC